MLAGKVFACDQWQMRLRFSASDSDGNGAALAAECHSRHVTLDPFGRRVLETGVRLRALAYYEDGHGNQRFSVTIPALGIDDAYVRPGYDDVGILTLDLFDVRVYVEKNGDALRWRLDASGLRWDVDGEVRREDGALTVFAPDDLLIPIAVPLMGVPTVLGCAADETLAPDPAEAGLWARASAFGGWRYRVGDSWIAPPVSLVVEPPPGGCAMRADLPTARASNTFEGFVEGGYELGGAGFIEHDCDVGRQCVLCACEPEEGGGFKWLTWDLVESRGWSRGGSIMLLPSLPRRVVRGGDDYGALIVRGGFPLARTRETSTCEDVRTFFCETHGGTTERASSTPTHPRLTRMLDAVDGAHSPIEDAFAPLVRAPYDLGAVQFDGRAIHNGQETGCTGERSPVGPAGDECECGIDPGSYSRSEAVSVSFPVTEFSDTNPDMLPQLDYRNPVGPERWIDHATRYVSYWANPHWSAFYWFYSPEAAEEVKWKVAGAPVEVADYWHPLRSQHLTHPELPAHRDRRTRASLLSAPIGDGALAGHVEEFYLGYPSAWWGVSRFQVDLADAPATKRLTAASEVAWTFEDCEATFFIDDVELMPSASVVRARYRIGGFDAPPFAYPHACDRIDVHWGEANVERVVVRLVSSAGESVVLTDDVQGRFRKPARGEPTYAGSWGQEFGLGVVADAGEDLREHGASEAAMADAELGTVFGLLPGRGVWHLEFEVHVVEVGEPVSLTYPRFVFPGGPALVVPETGQSQSGVWPQGPVSRFGHARYFDAGSGVFSVQPLAATIGSAPCAVDWLAWRRHFLEALDSVEGLDGEIAARWDARERGSDPVDYRLHAGRDTLAFVDPRNRREARRQLVLGDVGWRGVLVSSLAEVPPIAVLPGRSRSPVTLEATGSLALEAWAFDVEPRYFLNAGSALHLRDRSSGELWTSPDVGCAGWAVTSHRRPVGGSEAGACDAVVGGDAWARLSPWHGTTSVVAPAGAVAGPSYDVAPDMRHARGFVREGTVWIGVAPNGIAPGFFDRETTLEAGEVAVRWDRGARRRRLWLATAEGGEVRLRWTHDEGASVSMAPFIGFGAHPNLVVTQDNRVYLYWYDGGSIKGQVLSATGDELVSTFVALTDVDDGAFGVADYTLRGGEWRVGIVYSASGSLTFASSRDGVTFD